MDRNAVWSYLLYLRCKITWKWYSFDLSKKSVVCKKAGGASKGNLYPQVPVKQSADTDGCSDCSPTKNIMGKQIVTYKFIFELMDY